MTTKEKELRKEVPSGWPGSLPEYLVFLELLEQDKFPGLDFTYQAEKFGGRMEHGGLVIDFMFVNPPDLAINVQGEYFHYEQGSQIKSRDLLARAALAGQGINLVFMDEADVIDDASFYVREALLYRDHSRAARGM
jgi:hypothetical protein